MRFAAHGAELRCFAAKNSPTVETTVKNRMARIPPCLARACAREAVQISFHEFELKCEEAVKASGPQDVPSTIVAAAETAKQLIPFGVPVPGKPGLVVSPYDPTGRRYINVSPFPPGAPVKDPYTNKTFLVPLSEIR